jgi:alkanesulfonate monooxygenase SsuD/methylene tetrahydromethanopterin reductase-like flavin-dependent oxidoreductase (luciferase family)
LKLGINLPYRRTNGEAPTAREIMTRAAMIERLGYDAIYMGETVGRMDFAGVDTLAWLAAAAAGTSTIEIGSCVIQVPLRSPVELATRLMTLQALCGGRFVAGLGSGSTPKDFEATGVDFAGRFKLLRDYTATIKALLAGETVDDVNIHPWPNVKGGPPIVIGAGRSDRWIKRAAEEYDGWMASGFSGLAFLREGAQRYHDLGGTGRVICATANVDLRAPYAPLDEDGRYSLQCPPEEAARRLELLADAGYDLLVVTRLNYSDEDWPEEDLAQLRNLLPRERR